MTTVPITVTITNEVKDCAIDESRLCDAVRHVLERCGIDNAKVGVALVDDPTIHRLNRRYLQHDYPTDVLSFPMSAAGEPLEGELAVSVDTAAAEAARYGWNNEDELLLYVIHGTLHLVGYDDKIETAAAEMRSAETEALAHFGLEPHNKAIPANGLPSPTEEIGEAR